MNINSGYRSIEPEPPPSIHDLSINLKHKQYKPIFVRVIDLDEYNQDILSYDANLYEGRNDGANIIHLTCPHEMEQVYLCPSNCDILTCSSIHNDSTIDALSHSYENPNVTYNPQNVCCMQMNVTEKQQIDSGANKSVTSDKSILYEYTALSPIPIYGVEKDTIACHIIGKGNADLITMDGSYLTIRLYHAPECAGTIVSPNSIVMDSVNFTGWSQVSHVSSSTATMTFFNKDDCNKNKSIQMQMINGLWYIKQNYKPTINQLQLYGSSPSNDSPSDIHVYIRSMNKACEYELWHQRLMHVGNSAMSNIDKCTIGIPSLHKHAMRSCKICKEMNIKKTSNKNPTENLINSFGQRFQMDYGFMKAKVDNRNIRSHDGYSCYLLIIDSYTRYIWIFLNKNKNPPIKTVTQFLKSYGIKGPNCIVRTDQGGELAKSVSFRKVITDAGYRLETTGADNSAQNAIAERPHQTLANMVRAGLENSGLHVRFWSDAILHAVYVKNRLPHTAFQNKMTPYERLTGTKPDLSKLRIFGSRIVTRKPGKRSPKVSKHSYSGIFLRYAKTMKNIVYYDTHTKKIKTTTYAKFDEAHFSYENKPPGAQILMELGLKEESSQNTSLNALSIKKDDPDAIVPTKGSANAAGFDLYSLTGHTIKPNHVVIVDTGIIASFPKGTYGRIASRSGLASKHFIQVQGGVIDADYRGRLQVILHNFGNNDFTILKHDKIAQLIIEKNASPPINVVPEMDKTVRSDKGLGSTGLHKEPATTTPSNMNESTEDNHTSNVHIIPDDSSLNSVQISNLKACNLDMVYEEPIFTVKYNVPKVKLKKYPTLGLVLKKDERGPLIVDCERNSPITRTTNWRKLIKGTILYSINDMKVTNDTNVIQLINDCPTPTVPIQVIQENPPDIHEETGLPQLAFDQFIHVSRQHQDVIESAIHTFLDDDIDVIDNIIVHKIKKANLTRSKLLKQDDWKEWELSEFLQLDQYERQQMFGKPGPLPNHLDKYSILPMIWVYIVKSCGRKKARCVANGAPHLKGTITLANTYAACLEQSGFRIFWAICALRNKQVFGSDAANAFAEAPPPKCPLYLKVDAAFRNWYSNKYKISLPEDTYVKVNHAIQGHPEAPRLWQDHIDGILQKLGFKPTFHEPCIYSRTLESGEEIFLLRQVDDFAVGCDDISTANYLWDELDKHLREPLKRETGCITRHNGINVLQTKHFIRIHCADYIDKITSTKSFPMTPNHHLPIPMSNDNAYMANLEKMVGPTDPIERKKLEDEMGFGYRTATGELIFAMVTCRAEISFAVIKLSQFNNYPARCHYEAAMNVYRYLYATKYEGITFWRPTPCQSLPYHPWPQCTQESYIINIPEESKIDDLAYCIKDSDWAGATNNRKSVSGITIHFAGAAVIYKTLIQRIVALSSTEAEFYALTEAGKLILYLRMVLGDVGFEQKQPTTVYEDNKGVIHVTQASKPTKRMRHVETRHFAILQWIQKDLIRVKKIDTSDNSSDVLTKATGRVIFYRHMETITGKRTPLYVQYKDK